MPRIRAEKTIMDKPITAEKLGVDRAFVYRWLSGLFARELEGQVLNAYETPRGKALLHQLASDPLLSPLVSAVREILNDGARDDRVQELKSVFAKLFLGAGGMRSAPPYQSVYASEKGLLYQTPAMEMTELLRELQLSVDSSLKEPPDHLAIQLNVLAELIERTTNNASNRLPPERTRDNQTQLGFIERYLLSWLPVFRDDLRAHDPSQLYALAADTVLSVLQRDHEHLTRMESVTT